MPPAKQAIPINMTRGTPGPGPLFGNFDVWTCGKPAIMRVALATFGACSSGLNPAKGRAASRGNLATLF